MTSARLAAARVLLAVEERRTTLASAVERERAPLTDRRDRALLVELTAGTLRWRNLIDAYIAAAAGRPLEAIDPRSLALLRLGVYQLRHLTRVPPHAVVNESVEGARALGAPRAASFVNATLRAVSAGRRRPKLPARPQPTSPSEDWIRYLSIVESHPAWLVARWIDRYGPEPTERWCQFNNAPPEITVRPAAGESVGTLLEALQRHEPGASLARFAPDAVRLPPGTLGRLPADVLDRLRIQDEGSQLVATSAGARPGERVLDLCAAPGGKTLVLSGAIDLAHASNSLLVAADFRPSRVALLADTLSRAGVSVPIVALDARRPLPFRATFDCVLVDAPCSGLGTLRRDPDLKWTRQPDDLPRLASDESRILRAAADVVRPGGRVVYATCSGEPEENQGVVDAFLAEDRSYRREPLSPEMPPTGARDDRGSLMTLPFRDDLDAYYAALLVRRPAA